MKDKMDCVPSQYFGNVTKPKHFNLLMHQRKYALMNDVAVLEIPSLCCAYTLK